MPRLPFSFALTGTDDYGTPFSATDDAFGSNAELNGVLASIVGASHVPKDFGLGVPAVSRSYKVTRLIGVQTSDDTANLTFGIWDGSAFVAMYTILPTTENVDFGDGVVVSAGYIPALHYEGSGTPTVVGAIEWKE